MTTKLQAAQQLRDNARAQMLSLYQQLAVANFSHCVAKRWVNSLECGAGEAPPSSDIDQVCLISGGIEVLKGPINAYYGNPAGFKADAQAAYQAIANEIAAN